LLSVLAAAAWWQSATGPAPKASAPDASVPPLASPIGQAEREERASAVVAALDAAAASGERAAFVQAAGSSAQARRWAATVFRNLRLLGVDDTSWRYVAERDAASSSGVFVGDLAVTWSLSRRFDLATTGPVTVTVPLRFAQPDGGVAVLGAAPGPDPLPVWLAGRLQVTTVPGAVCVAVGHRSDPARLRSMAQQALRAVSAVVEPSTAVVLVDPGDGPTAARLLGSSSEQLAQIAAVTTAVDGSSDARSPAQVVINPPVFNALGPRGAQVVLGHEITHAVTGATTAEMPLWVAEGFADFVALRDAGVPVRTAAGQILAHVRRAGPPRRLPTAADFAASAHGLGRTYEASWLIFLMLAERYGDHTTVRFYEAVRDSAPLGRALSRHFGLDIDSLTVQWRNYLDRLAAA